MQKLKVYRWPKNYKQVFLIASHVETPLHIDVCSYFEASSMLSLISCDCDIKKIMYRITNRLTNTNLYKFSAFAPKIKSFFPDASYSCSTLSLQNCLTYFLLGIFEWNVALKCLWDKNNEVFLSTVSCTSKLSPSQEQDELAESSWVWHTASVLSEHIFKVRKDFSYKVVEAQKVRATLNALRPLHSPSRALWKLPSSTFSVRLLSCGGVELFEN